MPPRLPITRVDKFLYRSPQPDFEDLAFLKAEGLKTVVNLRLEAQETEFFARQLGLGYLYLPVQDWDLPEPEQVQQFLDLFGQPDKVPVLVHCAMGVGRTGTFVACYRRFRGLSVEESLAQSQAESPIKRVGMNDIQQMFVKQFRWQ